MIALCAIGQRFSIGRPAMQVRRAYRRYFFWFATCNRQNVNERSMFVTRLSLMAADPDPFFVRGQNMVVVAVFDKGSADDLRLRIVVHGVPVQVAAAVIDKGGTVF